MESVENTSGGGEAQESASPWTPQFAEQEDKAPSWAQGLIDRMDQFASSNGNQQQAADDSDDDFEFDFDEEDDDELDASYDFEDDDEDSEELTEQELDALRQYSPEQLAAAGIDPTIVYGPMADPQVRAMADRLQMLEQRLQTEADERTESRRDAEAEALERQYPDLQKPEVAAEVMKQARAFVRQIGADEDLILEPSFLEKVYKANLQDKRSEGEVPATRPLSGVETGGGVNPDSEDAIAELKKGIVNAGGRPFLSY